MILHGLFLCLLGSVLPSQESFPVSDSSAVDSTVRDSLKVDPPAVPEPVRPESARDSTALHASSGSPPKPVAVLASSLPRATWLVTLDLVDLGPEGLQQRHFHSWPKQANACCLDLAWLPGEALDKRLYWGASLNVGGWRQSLHEDWSHVLVVDAALGASVLMARDSTRMGPWVRADLGGSVLSVHRRTTGVAPGVAGQIRFGWGFAAWQRMWQVSAGTDGRWWPALDVPNDPVAILSVGTWL